MALEMRLPQLSDEMAEGLVSRWLKQVGDQVRKGEPIVEIETEKVIVEVEAEADGVLVEIVAAEQETVPVGGVLCRIGKAGEAPAAAAEPAPKAEPEPEPAPKPEPEPAPEPASPPAASAGSGQRASSNVVPLVHPGQPAGGGESVPATPLARRIAAELGIDLSRVEGSGIGGKIVKTDLQPFLGSALPQQPQPSPGMPESRPAPQPAAAGPGAAPPPGGEAVPHTPLRRTVARRMAESKSRIPHFYMTAEVDVTELLRLRGQLNADGEAPKISVNDLMIKAAALTLERVPAFNAAYGEEAVHRFEAAHIGFAVAIEGGLVTPVVRDCHLKSIGRIAREAAGLIERAKSRQLSGSDLEGGTFTISNMGMFDVVEFAAIINPPQVGILAVARPVERPVVVDGRVVVRSRLNATISADHRAVDGVTAAEFLREFKAVLENPVRLMR